MSGEENYNRNLPTNINRSKSLKVHSKNHETRKSSPSLVEKSNFHSNKDKDDSLDCQNKERTRLKRKPRSFYRFPKNYETVTDGSSNTNFNATNTTSTNNNNNRINNNNLKNVKKIDDFEYFCLVANHPKSACNNYLTTSNTTNTNTNNNRVNNNNNNVKGNVVNICYLPKRCNSMRNVNRSKLKDQNNDSENPIYLSPISRNHLIRSSTEENEKLGSDWHSETSSKAKLNYNYLQNSFSNLYLEPPKTIPTISTDLDDSFNLTKPIGNAITQESLEVDGPGLKFYQIQVLGNMNVGKSLLCHQLLDLANRNPSEYDPEEESESSDTHTITTDLYGSLYTIDFVDSVSNYIDNNLTLEICDCTDAFIVVYAIDDVISFESARLIIIALTSEANPESVLLTNQVKNREPFLINPALIYLVANKSDLVRGRQISSEEGRQLAATYGARFMEVSATLNHMVADLFVSIIDCLRKIEEMDSQTYHRYKQNHLAHTQCTFPDQSTNVKSNVLSVKLSTVRKAGFNKFLKKHFTCTSQTNN